MLGKGSAMNTSPSAASDFTGLECVTAFIESPLRATPGDPLLQASAGPGDDEVSEDEEESEEMEDSNRAIEDEPETKR